MKDLCLEREKTKKHFREPTLASKTIVWSGGGCHTLQYLQIIQRNAKFFSERFSFLPSLMTWTEGEGRLKW